MKDKLSINLSIVDRYYPLKIDREEEELIRRAAKVINEKVLQYKQRFAEKDGQDFLAMTALQYVTKVIEFEDKLNISPVVDSLKEVNDKLEEYLETQK